MLTRGIFITGTDTGVGKTYVTCQLSTVFQGMGHSVGLYKPVCSGGISERDPAPGGRENWIWEDIEKLAATLPLSTDREMICPQRFIAPLAPPVAASLEGTSVNSMQLRTGINAWLGQVEFLLVEGVGGWRSPIATGETVAELARDLNFPVLLVAANRLGMINH
ncbi:MAG TPA: dethiobiotin synthase, partial [Planctomicrobium sp.]|nr:dethiobiotin synthase [Planctomicrobium sp.]